MAVVHAASLLLSAVAEAAGLVWMELMMFGFAAICYVFFVGLPGLGPSAGGGRTKKILDKSGTSAKAAGGDPKTSPRGDASVMASWCRAKASQEEALKLDIVAVIHALGRSGKGPAEITEELRAGLTSNPGLLSVVASLPQALLRDDAVEMLDMVLQLLEGHGLMVEASIYAGLMAAQHRRRNYGRVLATGARLPEAARTPRMLAIMAAAAAQRGSLDAALDYVGQMPVPDEGTKGPLAGLVALQLLALAAKDGRAEGTVEQLRRLQVQLEDKHFEEFVASQGRRLTAAVLDELLRVCIPMGVSPELGQAAAAKWKAQLGSAGPGNGEFQRIASLIKQHAKERNLEAAAAVFDGLRASGASIPPVIYNCILDACVQCGDFPRAASFFEEMKRLEVVDTVGYNTMLKAHLLRGLTEEARALVKEMQERGLSANKVTYNELLHAKVMAKDRRGMWAVVEEMQLAGVQPNAVSCSIILKSLTGHGDVADLKRVIDLIDKAEVSVDEVLLSAVIETCIRIQQLALLSDLLRRFRQRGTCLNLSAPTYGAMIKAFGQAGDAARVQELWAEMQQHGVKPSSITLGCLTEALVVNGKAHEAWDLVREQMGSEEMRGHINTVIYSTVVKGFAVIKDMEKTFAVYDEMRAHGIPCNTITYNTILDACAKCCAMSRASKLLEDMSVTCTEPDIITYSTILKGYCMEGDLNRAFHILSEMKKDGKLKPDEIMYNSILDGCARQHRTDDALAVFEEMKASGISPSNYTLSILVKVLGHARRLSQAFDMVESLSKEHGFRPNVQVYTCLVQACIHNRRLDRALALHDTMVVDVGCTVDDKFYAVLARGCLQMRQPLKAVDVVRAAYQLPGHSLMRSSRRDGRHVGLEPKALQEVAARLQGGGREEQQAWSKLSAELEAAGPRTSGGAASGRPDVRAGVAHNRGGIGALR